MKTKTKTLDEKNLKVADITISWEDGLANLFR